MYIIFVYLCICLYVCVNVFHFERFVRRAGVGSTAPRAPSLRAPNSSGVAPLRAWTNIYLVIWTNTLVAYLPLNLVFSIVCILYPSSVFELCLVSWGFDPEFSPQGLDFLWMLTDLRSCVRCENLTIDTAAFREISNLRNSWQIVFAPIGPGPNFFKSAAPKHYKTKHSKTLHFCLVVESYWYELLKVWPKCLINYMYKCEAWSCSVWRVGGNMIRKCNSGLTNLFETCHKM